MPSRPKSTKKKPAPATAVSSAPSPKQYIYHFEPTEDITAYDLAKHVLPILLRRNFTEEALSKVPANVQAYFRKEEMPEEMRLQMQQRQIAQRLQQIAAKRKEDVTLDGGTAKG